MEVERGFDTILLVKLLLGEATVNRGNACAIRAQDQFSQSIKQ